MRILIVVAIVAGLFVATQFVDAGQSVYSASCAGTTTTVNSYSCAGSATQARVQILRRAPIRTWLANRPARNFLSSGCGN